MKSDFDYKDTFTDDPDILSLTYMSNYDRPSEASSEPLLTSHQTLILIAIVFGLIILNIVIASLLFYRW